MKIDDRIKIAGTKIVDGKRYWSPTATARLCRTNTSMLNRLTEIGKIPSARLKIGKRFWYTDEEISHVQKVVVAIYIQMNKMKLRYSISEVADLIGVSNPTIVWHLQHNCFSLPTRMPYGCFFTEEQLEEIKRYFALRQEAYKKYCYFQVELYALGADQNLLNWIKRRPEIHPEPAVVLGDGRRNKFYYKKDIKKLYLEAKELYKPNAPRNKTI